MVFPWIVDICIHMLSRKSIDYTGECYSCRYKVHNRVSDISLGDSWEVNCLSGISLVLCQTKKGEELLKSQMWNYLMQITRVIN